MFVYIQIKINRLSFEIRDILDSLAIVDRTIGFPAFRRVHQDRSFYYKAKRTHCSSTMRCLIVRNKFNHSSCFIINFNEY